jgi:hypothetical protein
MLDHADDMAVDLVEARPSTNEAPCVAACASRKRQQQRKNSSASAWGGRGTLEPTSQEGRSFHGERRVL